MNDFPPEIMYNVTGRYVWEEVEMLPGRLERRLPLLASSLWAA